MSLPQSQPFNSSLLSVLQCGTKLLWHYQNNEEFPLVANGSKNMMFMLRQ